MRMLMFVYPSAQKFNSMIRDGTASAKMGKILEAIKPEAVYFTEDDGRRSAILILDVADPSKVPALAEPWFLTFDAEVKLRIVMTPQDLQKAGLEELGKKWG